MRRWSCISRLSLLEICVQCAELLVQAALKIVVVPGAGLVEKLK